MSELEAEVGVARSLSCVSRYVSEQYVTRDEAKTGRLGD